MTILERPEKGGALPIRLGLREWSGALGDLGTFVPVYMSLVALNGLPPARSIFLVGLVYITAALYFRLPIPVQPLKAMAAIAIAGGLGMPMISAAGIWMGLILLLLVLTGKIDWLSRYFTRPIVKGIQLGVGLMLIKTSVGLFTLSSCPVVESARIAPLSLPELSIFLPALWVLVLPQLPLTLGNAVYAASDVARDYFVESARRASPRRLALSLGFSNILIGFLGGLPVCHGSGGFTAHYRFGARTAGATLITGGAFVLISVIFVGSGDLIFSSIPPWVLGSMLLYVALCHVWLIRRLREKPAVAVVMGLAGVMSGNLMYALILGLLMESLLERVKRRK